MLAKYKEPRGRNALENSRSKKSPTLSQHDIITIALCSGSLQKFEWDFKVLSRSSWHDAVMQYPAAEYLKPRIAALHEESDTLHDSSSGSSVIGAILPLETDWSALLTMKLRFDGERVQSLYSVAKFGSVFSVFGQVGFLIIIVTFRPNLFADGEPQAKI